MLKLPFHFVASEQLSQSYRTFAQIRVVICAPHVFAFIVIFGSHTIEQIYTLGRIVWHNILNNRIPVSWQFNDAIRCVFHHFFIRLVGYVGSIGIEDNFWVTPVFHVRPVLDRAVSPGAVITHLLIVHEVPTGGSTRTISRIVFCEHTEADVAQLSEANLSGIAGTGRFALTGKDAEVDGITGCVSVLCHGSKLISGSTCRQQH